MIEDSPAAKPLSLLKKLTGIQQEKASWIKKAD